MRILILALLLTACAKEGESLYPIADQYGHTDQFQQELINYYGVEPSVFKICSHIATYCDSPARLEAFVQDIVANQ